MGRTLALGPSLPAYRVLFHAASRAKGISSGGGGGGQQGTGTWACSAGMSLLLSLALTFLRDYVLRNLRTSLGENIRVRGLLESM